jgi:predicted phosphate transport protein (TIGR00153 family)
MALPGSGLSFGELFFEEDVNAWAGLMPGRDMAKIFRKDEKFLRIFGQMTVYILEAAEILGTMLRNPGADPAPAASRIKDLEHKGDELTHHVIDELNKTFITPIDREDIHDLCAALDDVLDLIDSTATRLVLFRIAEPIRSVPEISAVLLSQAMEIGAAVSNLQDNDHVVERCIEINRLENDADRLFQSAIASMFEEVKDPIEVIKRKEIIETLETATDKAEDVANVLESIVVKNT